MTHQGVTTLVVGDDATLGLGHHAALALRARHDALHGLLDLVHRDEGAVAAGGK